MVHSFSFKTLFHLSISVANTHRVWVLIDTPGYLEEYNLAMPIRPTPLVNDIYYHIFNRGVNKQPIFTNKYDFKRALNLLHYYKYSGSELRFSKFLTLPANQRKEIWHTFETTKPIVDIVSYCLMPNHFHLLLKQNVNDGIAKFTANFQNSYAKYFNIKYERVGPLFQGRFRNVIVDSDEQLFHLSRYIHLNPSTSNTISIEKLEDYKWSSFKEYLDNDEYKLCCKNIILSNFKVPGSYKKFVLDYANYQKELGKIKHLIIEK